MKRFLALLLMLILALSTAACSAAENPETTAAAGTEPTEPAVFMAGFGREDITPAVSVPLAGYGNGGARLSENVLDPLYFTCIAFREGDQTLLWITADVHSAFEQQIATARMRISRRTGVPADRVMICCTHTHSSPQLSAIGNAMDSYLEEFQNAALKAAETAIADLAPATLYGAKAEVSDLNFVRHYLMNDGSYRGPNFGSTESGYKDHLRDSDREMLLVKAQREGDKQDILLMNWQAHPTLTGGATKKDVSADFIGAVRKAVERDANVLFALFQGAGGDLTATSFIEGETLYPDTDSYGEQLAKEAIGAMENMQPITGSGIRSQRLMYEAAVNHEDEAYLEQAQQVIAHFKATDDVSKANALARQLGLTSYYHANAIVSRPGRPEKDVMEINAVSVGGMALITAPFEMFSETGIDIKEGSPFDMTFICTNANESHSYIPTREAYEYGCYESYVSYFAKGTAEAVGEKYVEMLDGLK